MAQVILAAEMAGPYEINGTQYWQMDCSCLTSDFLPAGKLAKLVKWLDRALPDPDLLEYFPKTIQQGSGLSGWIDNADPQFVAPVTLYLMGAKCQGGLGSDWLGLYLITYCTAYYTSTPPDEYGNFFLPDGDTPPDGNTHIEIPLGSGWRFWVPNDGTLRQETWAQFWRNGYTSTWFYPAMLFLCNGVTVTNSLHFLDENVLDTAVEQVLSSLYLGKSLGWLNVSPQPFLSAYNVYMEGFDPLLTCWYEQYSYGDNRQWWVEFYASDTPAFYVYGEPPELPALPPCGNTPFVGLPSVRHRVLGSSALDFDGEPLYFDEVELEG